VGLTTQDILDIGNAYLEDHDGPDAKLHDASRLYRKHIGTSELWARKKTGAPADSFTWNIKTGSADNTQLDGLFSKDNLNRTDLTSKATGRYSMQKTHFLYDRREPAFMSGSKTQIYDYLKTQEWDMYDGFFEQNEEYVWTVPTAPNTGTTGDIAPYGIPSQIVQDTTQAFGFNGGDHSTYSDTFGLVKDNNVKLRNGTATYSSADQMEEVLNDALDLCSFEPPYKGSSALGEDVPDMNYGLYSSRKPYKDYQTLLYASNDNIGADMGKYRNRATGGAGPQQYRGVPWYEVPALSLVGGAVRDLNEPIYGLDWSTWEIRTYGGMFMQKDEVIKLNDSHNTFVCWMDTGYQMICKSFRNNFVLRATTASAT
jgi:hypothetical protein